MLGKAVPLLRYAAHVAILAIVLGGMLLFYSCVRPTQSTGGQAVVESLNAPPIIHVGLSAYKEAKFIPVAVEGAFEIVTLDGKVNLLEGSLLPRTDISADGTGLNLGRQQTGTDVIDIIPTFDATLKVDKRFYRGKLRVYRTAGDRVSAVNILDLESYLAGVVGAEMILAWPQEALKAQAVAARSYAVWEMKRSRENWPNRPYDLQDDTSSQCYLGCERETPKALDVVRDTRAAVLLFAGKIVPAFYSSTCGGHTSSAVKVGFPVADTTPLMGITCGQCAGTKYYEWKHSATSSELAGALRPSAKSRRTVESITPIETDAGGRVFTVSVRFAGETKEETMTARDFRGLVGAGKLKSALFTITRSGNKYDFVGRGWGHGVGLCQYGAMKLAGDGLDYTDILRFYFPGAQVTRLYK